MAKFRFVGALMVVVMVLHTRVWAADVDILTAPPDGPVTGGDTIILRLYIHNNTDHDIVKTLPARVPCQVEAASTRKTVQAELIGGEAESLVEIPANGFSRRQYRVELPGYEEGMVRVVLMTLQTNDLTLTVKKAEPETWAGDQIPIDQGSVLAQTFLDNFSIYEPTYFLFGVHPGLEKTKFQFSFKYRLFGSGDDPAGQFPSLSSIYIAYTQRSFWDLKSDSKPFNDTSYMPQMFYEIPLINLNMDRVVAFGARFGFMHESNGNGGDDSRSTNYLYVQPIMAMHLADDYYLRIAPRIFTYVNNEDDTNGDLEAYRGYFDLVTSITDPDGISLQSHLWWARRGPSIQLDLSYPMTRIFSGLMNLYLQAQYFSGYGETLIDYNKRNDVFRLGFALSR
ncbi:phospholipase A [Desulfosarcina sp. OttesenSCG-928-A07]|nr:phospholipase A [Desulfosarcina sp. OttesenSCG-928-G17]MDL2329863.1 phospholipase A [Desulfosarcina sp. OttesenSCG-928-A07]